MIVRIRQIRPEFFTDPVTGHLSPATQVTYIGLWCVADDAGWLTWDVEQLGVLLSPYKSRPVRTRAIERARDELVAAGRLVIHPCGCAFIPKLVTHQKIGGNKAFTVRDRHRVHTNMDKSALKGTVSNVTVGNGTLDAPAPDPDGPVGAGRLKERVAAHGYEPS